MKRHLPKIAFFVFAILSVWATETYGQLEVSKGATERWNFFEGNSYNLQLSHTGVDQRTSLGFNVAFTLNFGDFESYSQYGAKAVYRFGHKNDSFFLDTALGADYTDNVYASAFIKPSFGVSDCIRVNLKFEQVGDWQSQFNVGVSFNLERL